MIIGITGTLASGKSTVSKTIADITNARLLDADKIAHSILEKNSAVMQELVGIFGNGILDKNNKIDRKKLAEIVFSDRGKLKILCNVVHPKVIAEIKEIAEAVLGNNKDAFVIIDAPLLIEAGLDDSCDLVIVVTAPVSDILERTKKSYGLSKEDAIKRINSQMLLSEKEKRADYVINNNGSLKELENKIRELVKRIG